MSATLTTKDHRPVLRIERRLAHPPAKVWRAITEPAHLSTWYPFPARSIDLRVGGVIHFGDGQDFAMEAIITELDPPHVFAFSEHAPESMSRESDDLVHFELRPDDQGCLLIFTHVFNDRPAAASYASGWSVCLDSLEQHLDAKPVKMARPSAQLHEYYVKMFGLDEGSIEATSDGWQIRFERQLTSPIDAVWSALHDSGTPLLIGESVPAAFTIDQIEVGAITAVQAPTLLEYVWLLPEREAGRVRWELSQGTGHGARLVLTQTGPKELADKQSSIMAAWKKRIEKLVQQLVEIG